MTLVSSAEIPVIPQGGSHRDVYSPPLLPARLDNGQFTDILLRFPRLKGLNSDSPPGTILDAFGLDGITRTHSERVANLGDKVHPYLYKYGISIPKTVLYKGAKLHDIGKRAVNQKILNSPDLPPDRVTSEIRIPHVEEGAKFLATIGAHPFIEFAGAHHERWNGSGYPSGLRGYNIPVGARIVAPLDSLDASQRSYNRKTGPIFDGPTDIVAQAGLQFDPRVINAIIDAMRDGRIDPGSVPTHLDNNRDVIMAAKEVAGLPREL